MFSNEPSFYEKYLQYFSEECYDKKVNFRFKLKIESHYKVKFNFDEKLLEFPNFKCEGKYGDLKF